MENVGKLFWGILLAIIGTVIIYQSYYNRLIDIFLIFGFILAIIGAYLLLVVIFQNRSKKSKKIKSSTSKYSSRIHDGDSNGNNKIKPIDSKKITKKFKEASQTKNQKAVLKTPNSKSKDTKKTGTDKKFKFTPNYEKPVKVTRKPQKKADLLDLTNVPDISKLPKTNKSKEISKALATDNFEPKYNGTIQNNIIDKKSKDLQSYVVNRKGVTTSKEAFRDLANDSTDEILLEASSIKKMGNDFISQLSDLKVKILIQDFDIKDMSYVLLISSLIEQGVSIKTLPLVNSINLVVDSKKALIISENDDKLEVGAVFTNRKDVLEIKDTFEKSWELANDFDLNILK